MLLRFLAILFMIFSFKTPVLAVGNFSDYYNVSYNIQADGKTQVTQNISIVNNTLDTYASDYKVTIGSENIEEVRARDRQGELIPQVVKKNGSTEITVVFRDKVVGDKRALNWTLEYLSADVARKRGSIWEIIIPRITFSPDLTDYTLKINVPRVFGNKIYVSPKPDEEKVATDNYFYRFGKEAYAAKGVMMAFGGPQKFSLDLTYHVRNSNLVSSYVEVALPPDIFAEQQIVIDELTPRPLNVRVDEDGNYLAQYKVGAWQTMEVRLKGKALIFHQAPLLGSAGKIEETPLNLREEYTRSKKFWESNDPEIIKVVSNLVDKNVSAAKNAQNIYSYVLDHLSYGWEEVKKGFLVRRGAKKALTDKSASVCMDYADLLITLLRAGGIPARRLVGFAYSENNLTQPTPTDSLHTWVQAYLPKVGWVGFDPTWGATTHGLDYFSKLDTNHIVFAINGTSSETPYPAGTYKLNFEQSNDLKVDFLPDLNYQPSSISFNTTYLRKKFKIENTSAVTILDLIVQTSQNGKKTEFNPVTLPPFAFKEYSLSFDTEQPLEVSLIYKDFAGRLKEETRVLMRQKEPLSTENQEDSRAKVLAGLLLCGTVFAGLVLWVGRRKLLAHLPLRPPDQDQ